MSENDPESESGPLDIEDWQIAFAPYEGHPLDALTLAFHLTALKRDINGLRMQEALAAMDRAIDCLYQHSEFRSVSRDLFLIAIDGRLSTDKEQLLRELGIRV